MKSQSVRENEKCFLINPRWGQTLLPELKEDIEPVEDEVWSVSRHCHVLNNQQPPLRLRGLVCHRKLTWLDLTRNFGDIHEKLQIAKNSFFLEKSHISPTKTFEFFICLLMLRIKMIKISSHRKSYLVIFFRRGGLV
jgi:hypothetical protein